DATSLGGLVLLLSKENFTIFSALVDCENGSNNLSRLIGLKESLVMLKSDNSLPETLSNLASEILDAIDFKKPKSRMKKLKRMLRYPRNVSYRSFTIFVILNFRIVF
ncbi:unnamed protein product, partial [Hymenolepis diminuta]